MTPMRSSLCGPKSADAGNTMVSFALILPVFLPLFMATFEFGMYQYSGANLEAAIREAARFGATGAVHEGSTREEHLLQIVNERTFGMLDPEHADIVTTVYPSFDAVGGDDGAPGMGGPGDVVLYEVTYQWPAITPMVGHLVNGETLSVSVAIANEEF